MNGPSFTAAITVAKPPQEVFACLKDVVGWWSTDFEGRSREPQDEFVIRHPGRHYSRQRLVEVVPDERLVWLVTESHLDRLERDQEEWTGTRMIFELTPTGEGTRLRFMHEGLVPTNACDDRCAQGGRW